MRALTCREVIELVTEYLDGTLATDEREALERHLAGCDGCTTYIDQVRAVVTVAGSAVAEKLPPELEQSLLEAFRDFKRTTS